MRIRLEQAKQLHERLAALARVLDKIEVARHLKLSENAHKKDPEYPVMLALSEIVALSQAIEALIT